MIHQISLLSEPNIFVKANFTIAKHNESHFKTNGEVEWKIPLDDSMKLDVFVFHLDENNNYEVVGSERFHPLCSKLYRYQDEALFNDLKYASNIWSFNECPIPAVRIGLKKN